MKALYSIEVRYPSGWRYITACSSLALARSLRDRLYQGLTTRIRKWVRP